MRVRTEAPRPRRRGEPGRAGERGAGFVAAGIDQPHLDRARGVGAEADDAHARGFFLLQRGEDLADRTHQRLLDVHVDRLGAGRGVDAQLGLQPVRGDDEAARPVGLQHADVGHVVAHAQRRRQPRVATRHSTPSPVYRAPLPDGAAASDRVLPSRVTRACDWPI